MVLPSGLPDQVGGSEVLARHVFTKAHITTDPKHPKRKWAKPQAFLPQPGADGWVFSVSRTMRLLSDEDIQRNGMEVGEVSQRGYKGSALLEADVIRAIIVKDSAGDGLHQLAVVAHEAADGSTPYHAHVAGFLPLPEGANPKEFFKEASEELALRAKEHRFIHRTLVDGPGGPGS